MHWELRCRTGREVVVAMVLAGSTGHWAEGRSCLMVDTTDVDRTGTLDRPQSHSPLFPPASREGVQVAHLLYHPPHPPSLVP